LKNRGSEVAAPVVEVPKVEVAAPVVASPKVEVPAVVAPVAVAPTTGIKGYAPDANYSGACHVMGNVASKKYTINSTSNTTMVLKQDANSVCFASEKMARTYGFSK
jgi:hypothetical protein